MADTRVTIAGSIYFQQPNQEPICQSITNHQTILNFDGVQILDKTCLVKLEPIELVTYWIKSPRVIFIQFPIENGEEINRRDELVFISFDQGETYPIHIVPGGFIQLNLARDFTSLLLKSRFKKVLVRVVVI